MINKISSFIIPIMVLIVICYGLHKKNNIYDSFTDGAKESIPMVLSLFPSLLGMIFGINIFLKSGFLTFILNIIKPLFGNINVPIEILPMAIIRPISGSSALAILTNILSDYGPDSLIGKIASCIQGSTDTTFYVLTLYYGSVGIKKIKYSLKVGLLADFVGIVTSIIVVKLLI